MEIQDAQPTKPEKKPQKKFQLKKLDPETMKLLAQIKEKANKKPYGRKVRDSEIIAIAMKLVGAGEIRELQEATYTEHDRLLMAHEEYQKRNGKLSLDAFIGKLLVGEVKANASS